MIKIRKYRDKDEEQVKEMIISVLTQIFGSLGIKEWEDFSEYELMLVAEDSNRIIGSAALKYMCNNVGKLKRMYISTEYRNRGIASKMLKKIQEFAIKKDITRIILSTSYPQLKDAFEFYKRKGFTEMADVDWEKDFPDLKNETVNLSEIRFMEKSL
jgi:N-acetylglutamate synthase-like GNAT family acetyltransferase